MEITDEMLLNAPATIRSVKEVQAKYDALLEIVSRVNVQNGKLIELLEGLNKRLIKVEDWVMDLREQGIVTGQALIAMDERIGNLPVLGGLVE